MDHLVQATQGKKGFATKRLILFSNFSQPFTDDQVDTIIDGIKNSGTELNVIGPQLNEEDDDDDTDEPTIDNNFGKEKSPQMRAGEAMIKHILSEVNGDSYSFLEALPALSYFQARQVRQTAWKVQMEIGTDLKIPVCGYTKIKDFKLKQSWKKVYAKDSESEVGNLRTQHKNDEEETEVDPEEQVDGYRYGNTLVPMSSDDKENMKYRAVKCLKILGFTKSENIKRHHYLGDGTIAFVADKGDEAAAVALSALINALYETDSVMCLLSKALKPNDPLPELSPLIASYFKRPEEVECKIMKPLEEIKDLFKLEIVAKKKDEKSGDAMFKDKYAAAVALSALINALYETDSVMVARRVYAANSAPRLGCLLPVIKTDYECLYWIELPFMEDLRQFTFGSLPVTDDVQTNKKFKPSADQLKVMDDLITNMDLSKKEGDEDSAEVLKPKLTFNPYFQRTYQCLLSKALKPNDPLPELSPLIASYFKRPEEVECKIMKPLEEIKDLFKLEIVAKKKDEKSGDAMFKDKEEDGPAAKKVKIDDDFEGGLENIGRAKITEVGSVTPVEDFKALINYRDEDLFDKACEQMEKTIEKIVMDSFGPQFYGKASDCLKAYREECIKNSKPDVYNKFIRQFKETLISKAKRDFWDQIVLDKQGLISKLECEGSKVSKEEADALLADDVKKEGSQKIEEADDADDLLDMM
ncbi:hypothetical protein LOTGIDRAFT_235806 [Lottia gigantea]|uniref:ATP-dependent DNA helicase II subunit 2 n=1 Tax=Lottia gigantea TaxID=225164 RepID=V4B8X8_LOTGI|nr:hypothetical protein LOTGIDRAFT_235806 [Lottia gigantea]ESO85299.1 hypothetical protein LOTGIDRAFT_235806 [Lottia gigantea]